MKRLYIFLIMLLALLLPATALAHDFEVDGIYYNINGNEATVTYRGTNSLNHNTYSGDVTIPSSVTYNGTSYSVTSIGDAAFRGCSGLTSITIPNSVTSIGDNAFYGRRGLTSISVESSNPNYDSRNNCNAIIETATNTLIVGCKNTTIPNSVTAIGNYAFYGCSGLTSVSIPNSVTSIGHWAFIGCSGLTSITIPNSVTSIGDNAFYLCTGLTSITVAGSNPTYDSRGNCNAIIKSYSNTLILGCMNTVIPNTVTSIDNFAFYGCSGLTSVTIPNSVILIGSYAFYGCSGLTSVTIPNSVIAIANNVFEDCTGLTSVSIGNSVTSIDNQAFYGCTGLTSVSIGNSVIEIGNQAFYGCTGLTSISVESSNPNYDSRNNCNAIIETATNTLIVGCKNTTIPNSVTAIGSYAFYGCSGLTSVTIPNSVIAIANNVFEDCTGLTSVSIGNSVIDIGDQAFYGCTGLNEIYSLALTPPTIYSDTFYGCYGATLYVPKEAVNAYKAANYWNNFTNIVEMEPDAVLATSIELDVTECEITEGGTLQLTVNVLPEDTSDKTVTWASSDANVAMVDENGLVTAVAPGTATITATTNDGSDLNASCNVTVLQGIVIAESIKLNVTTAGLNEGSTLQLTATVLPEDCASKTVLWSSDNPNVATVDNNGLVTTHSVGTATITATTTDGSNLSTTCTVTLLPVGVKGDVNGDSNISIKDVTDLIDYLLSGTWN